MGFRSDAQCDKTSKFLPKVLKNKKFVVLSYVSCDLRLDTSLTSFDVGVDVDVAINMVWTSTATTTSTRKCDRQIL